MHRAMFFLVGLGLGNERDITVKGLEIVKKCATVYLEAYTAILAVDKTALVRDTQRLLVLPRSWLPPRSHCRRSSTGAL